MHSSIARCHIKEKGGTLAELLAVIGIVQTCVLLLLPSMSHLVYTQRVSGLTQALVSSLHLARDEAIKRNIRVVLCKSSDGNSCANLGGWEQGWIIFSDGNNNGVRDASDQVLLQRGGVQGVRLTGNTPVRNYVSYTPLGTAKLPSGAFQSGTFTLCVPDSRGTKERKIILSPTGRPRSLEVASGECG